MNCERIGWGQGAAMALNYKRENYPVLTYLTPLAEYSSGLKDRQVMISQFVFVLKMRIKHMFPFFVHRRFLFFLSSPQNTCVII